MKTIALKGDSRESVGTKSAKMLRTNGQVPCVLYGHEQIVHFAVYEADFKNLVYTPNTYTVQLDINGNIHRAILQDIQFHPVSDAIIHADFLVITDDKPITIDIPVKITGNSPGVREGGKLVVKMKKMRVKGLLKDLPDFIEANIDTLEKGKSIRVADIQVPGIELLNAKNNAIVSVVQTRASMEMEKAAGGKK